MSNPYQSPQTESAGPSPASPGMRLGPSAILLSLEGRISRRVFWRYTVPLLVVWIGASQILTFDSVRHGIYEPWGAPLAVLAAWAQIALAVKRLHDRDRSGWYLMYNLLPIVGWMWTVAEVGFRRGTEGHNRFGDDPT